MGGVIPNQTFSAKKNILPWHFNMQTLGQIGDCKKIFLIAEAKIFDKKKDLIFITRENHNALFKIKRDYLYEEIIKTNNMEEPINRLVEIAYEDSFS